MEDGGSLHFFENLFERRGMLEHHRTHHTPSHHHTIHHEKILVENHQHDQDVECRLIGGTFAIVIQLLLGVVVLSALFMKRYVNLCSCKFREPQRDFRIWALDVGKQAIGSMCPNGSTDPLGSVAAKKAFSRICSI